MKSGSERKPEIILRGDFGDVAVTVNGRRAEFRADGSVLVDGKEAVASVPANDAGATKERAPPRVGERMPDGTVCAGISPDTHKPLYTSVADAPLKMSWTGAAKYAAAFDGHGHKDWRVPTRGELNLLFANRTSFREGLEPGESFFDALYWSSTANRVNPNYAASQNVNCKIWISKEDKAAVRLVRG
jgi:hypothetical protein